ncbi:hypothetical protein [Companilactobacillus kimchiensis]|uniref:hypothetical protein n=1 Tax=Companilactobacillus kimchiensis TaxID=993692 RepID=UPI00070A5004|nr:hypothetical protein [Companilactobacillus kimchiensis]
MSNSVIDHWVVFIQLVALINLALNLNWKAFVKSFNESSRFWSIVAAIVIMIPILNELVNGIIGGIKGANHIQ